MYALMILRGSPDGTKNDSARRMDDAAKQLSAVADHLRSQVPRAAGARVLRPDFSRREPEDS